VLRDHNQLNSIERSCNKKARDQDQNLKTQTMTERHSRDVGIPKFWVHVNPRILTRIRASPNSHTICGSASANGRVHSPHISAT